MNRRGYLGALTLLLAGPAGAHTELVLNRQARADAVSVETTLFGPVQVRLSAPDGRVLDERVLNGPGRFRIDGVAASGLAGLRLTAVPGKPARHDGSEYRQPFSAYADGPVSQGFHGQASHRDAANAYAMDFALLLGTPVLAARGGTVMEVVDGFPDDGGARAADLDKANLVRILHEDGSMALYAHLMQDSVTVRPGQWVALGSTIGQSGNSGYSRGPHLHFAVQVNAGMRLESVPFRLRAADGSLIVSP